ncbi:MAG: hypothetical protein SFU25_09455 [Candidatus Caenarcaniphilales bacterium]|nr:hypothetical protein [Candidatus Caenarcaniphilales bacterium]
MNGISPIFGNTNYSSQINGSPKPPSAEEAAKKFLSNYGSQTTGSNGQTQTVVTKDKFLEALKNLPKPPSIGNASNSKMDEKLFAKADTNSDGVLDQTELQASIQKMQAQHSHNGNRPQPPDPSKFVTAEGVTKEQLIQNIKNDMQQNAPDSNSGGQGGMSERADKIASEIADKLFAGDTNQDGKLTTTEVEEIKKKQSESMTTNNASSSSLEQIASLVNSTLNS